MNIKEHKHDIIAISSLIIIVTVITLLLLNIDGKAGVYYVRDVYFYLNNALFYAGYDSGLAYNRGLSPLIPMITSIFFRMGYTTDLTILLVSSIFYIFSALGMYFLMRLKFNEILSFTGSMLLSTFPLVIVWITKGMLDIPALCISIWSVYFMLLSFRKNIKYLYVAFPLVMLGFFTRYTVILMIPVLLIPFLLVDDPLTYIKNNLKDILIGIGAGTLILAIFIGIYSYLNIDLFFLTQGQGISNSTHNSITTTQNNIFYYINNFLIYLGTPNFIPYSLKPGSFSITKMQWHGGYPSIISYILLIILIAGAILYLKKIVSAENKEILKNEKNNLKFAIFLIGLLIFLFTFLKISILLSIVIITVSLLALYKILNKTKIDDFNLDFIMMYWFVINFAFFTYYHIKVDRYFMPMLPTIAYFIVLSISLIFNKFKSRKHIDKIKTIAPIGLICMILLFSGVFAMTNTPHTYDNQVHANFATAALEEKNVGQWLIEHDPQYANKTIWADRGGDMGFILKMQIPSVEMVSNSSNFTSEMVKQNVTYFIAKDNKTIEEPYVKLYQNGEVSLYYLNDNNEYLQ